MAALLEALKAGKVPESVALIKSASPADLNVRGPDGPPPADGGATALITAIRNFDITHDVVQAMLDRGADPNLPDTYDQECPLMAAIRTYPYDPALVTILLAKGANMEATNKHGETCLHVAAASQAATIAAFLISRGANYKAKDRKGRVPLDLAQDVPTQSSIEEAIASL